VPLARSVVSIPAGMARMPLLRFSLLTTVGSLAWNVLLVGAGYQLGARWEDVSDVIGTLSDVMLVVFILALVALAVWLWKRPSIRGVLRGR
jgi:membrane protein DedA with SNARE-associated domain